MPRVRILQPPLINQAENVRLWHEGDEADINEITGYWQGMIDRGVVALVDDTTPSLDSMTKAELVAYAAESLSLELDPKELNKAAMIEAVENAQAAADTTPEE